MKRRVFAYQSIVLAFVLAAACLTGIVFAADDQPQPDRNTVVNHLNAIITWYRDAAANVAPGELPSDAIFQQNVRTFAAQAVQLAFEAAHAESSLLGETPASSAENGTQTTAYSQAQSQVSQRMADDQSKLDALNKQLPSMSGAKRKDAEAQRDSLAGQINLDKAMLDALQKMSQFVELSSANENGLEGSIKQLADSVPEVVTQKGTPAPEIQKPSQASTPITVKSGGLIGQLVTLYNQVESMRTISRLIAENNRVTQSANTLRDPLRAQVRTIVQNASQGAPLSGNQPAGNAPPAAAAPTPQNYSQITKQFNQIAAALLPLSQELIVLDQSRSNLQEWRGSISSESKRDLIGLLLRVFAIAIALGIVWILSEVWRRLTFKYVHEPRRRRQFLTLRRFVMGFFFTLVVVMGFVSQFGSLATYAGFVTAGIAVGLQTLLLSVAAYFFVVGRYGIRIGDRISVAGVTGDVVDVGLVRLYIMELAGTGVDLYPTGRIAVFSNSVLFQPTTPLFKQVPGTEYAWHEVSIAIAPAGDHKAVHERTFAAVNSVYGEYKDVIESQQGTVGDRDEIVLQAPKPEAKFQLNSDGLELMIRYPVLLDRASEIDDRMAQAVTDVLATDGLKAAITGTPKIQAAVKG